MMDTYVLLIASIFCAVSFVFGTSSSSSRVFSWPLLCAGEGYSVGLQRSTTMAGMVRSCIKSMLKLVNSVIGMVGIAMILYAMWLIRVWHREMDRSPFVPSDYPAPWFIYTFLGLGITLCVITCSGHIAAETVNGCCLYMYMLFLLLLIMIEVAVTVDVFLNRDWEKDFPNDPPGSFNKLKDFIRSNFEFCKWIGLSIVSAQGLSLLLAMVLKALGPHQYYDSDDDFESARAPLLRNTQPLPYGATDPVYGAKRIMMHGI